MKIVLTDGNPADAYKLGEEREMYEREALSPVFHSKKPGFKQKMELIADTMQTLLTEVLDIPATVEWVPGKSDRGRFKAHVKLEYAETLPPVSTIPTIGISADRMCEDCRFALCAIDVPPCSECVTSPGKRNFIPADQFLPENRMYWF